jgi:hypothetical protein
MSKLTSLSMVFTLMTVLFLMPSCSKLNGYWHNHPDAHDTLCRVEQLSFGSPTGFQISISYNAKGDPTDMLYTDPNSPVFNIEQHFRYDCFERLTDYYFNFVHNTGVLIWHKYAYPRPDIITDTLLENMGLITDPVPPVYTQQNGRVFMYKSDIDGKRIATAELTPGPHQPPPVFTPVQYDARGNMVVPYTDIVYDNTIHVYRTNKVWQQVYGDYSRNNPTHSGLSPANPYGLPTSLPWIDEGNILYFGYYYPTAVFYITYACSPPTQSQQY